jgi:hypothetical protein
LAALLRQTHLCTCSASQNELLSLPSTGEGTTLPKGLCPAFRQKGREENLSWVLTLSFLQLKIILVPKGPILGGTSQYPSHQTKGVHPKCCVITAAMPEAGDRLSIIQPEGVPGWACLSS